VADFYERSDEPSVSIKVREFPDRLTDRLLIEEQCV